MSGAPVWRITIPSRYCESLEAELKSSTARKRTLHNGKITYPFCETTRVFKGSRNQLNFVLLRRSSLYYGFFPGKWDSNMLYLDPFFYIQSNAIGLDSESAVRI